MWGFESIISSAWRKLHDISAEEGSIGIDKGMGASAGYQFSKNLFNSSSAYFSCPLAMTDGALKVLMDHGGDKFLSALSSLAQDLNVWTSARWMTKKMETCQKLRLSQSLRRVWRLYGTKWFTGR